MLVGPNIIDVGRVVTVSRDERRRNALGVADRRRLCEVTRHLLRYCEINAIAYPVLVRVRAQKLDFVKCQSAHHGVWGEGGRRGHKQVIGRSLTASEGSHCNE